MSEYNKGKFQGTINRDTISSHSEKTVNLSGRYWILAWRGYYPSGGFSDVDSTHNDIDSALEALIESSKEYRNEEAQCELWDMTERKMLKAYEVKYGDVVEISQQFDTAR